MATAQSDDLRKCLAEQLEDGYKSHHQLSAFAEVQCVDCSISLSRSFIEDDPQSHLASPELPQRLPKDLNEAGQAFITGTIIDQPLDYAIKHAWCCATGRV